MPEYDFSKVEDRVACAREHFDPKVVALIVRKRYGERAVEEMREVWRRESKAACR